MNQAGGAEAKMTFLTPVGLYIFVHPVVFLVHDPYKHVGWFFALQKAPIKKMPNPPPPNPPSNSQWAMVQPMYQLLALAPAPHILTQFVLDCSSLNLPDCYRIPTHNPRISEIYKVSRDWTFGISSERSRLINQLKTKTTDSHLS